MKGSSLNHGWIPAKQLKPGTRLKTPDGQSAVVVGGSTPAVHSGWMWDLTVPGNNDHDFYVAVGTAADILVHNTNTPCEGAAAVDPVPDPEPVYKPNGAPNRGSPWYVSYRDAEGNIQTVGNEDEVHAEVRIQQMEPGWSLAEHLVRGSSRASWANDPWISTTTDQSVAEGFNQAGSKLGVVAIDLDQVPSVSAEGSQIYPRLPGEAGLPYYYSIWQQEVSVFKSIPQDAILGFVG